MHCDALYELIPFYTLYSLVILIGPKSTGLVAHVYFVNLPRIPTHDHQQRRPGEGLHSFEKVWGNECDVLYDFIGFYMVHL